MYPAVEKVVKPIIDRSITVVTNTMSGTREAVVSGARFLERGEKPVQILTHTGLRLNKISHKSIAGLVSIQAHMVEGTLQATARRLEKAANANSFRQLVSDQIALFPKTRDRLAGDARKTLDVFVDTRNELKDLIAATAAEFGKGRKNVVRGAGRSAKKATTKVRKTTAGAKKTTRKTTKKVSK